MKSGPPWSRSNSSAALPLLVRLSLRTRRLAVPICSMVGWPPVSSLTRRPMSWSPVAVTVTTGTSVPATWVSYNGNPLQGVGRNGLSIADGSAVAEPPDGAPRVAELPPQVVAEPGPDLVDDPPPVQVPDHDRQHQHTALRAAVGPPLPRALVVHVGRGQAAALARVDLAVPHPAPGPAGTAVRLVVARARDVQVAPRDCPPRGSVSNSAFSVAVLSLMSWASRDGRYGR